MACALVCVGVVVSSFCTKRRTKSESCLEWCPWLKMKKTTTMMTVMMMVCKYAWLFLMMCKMHINLVMMMMSSIPYHYYHKQCHNIVVCCMQVLCVYCFNYDLTNDAFMLDNIFGMFKNKCFIFFPKNYYLSLWLCHMGDVMCLLLCWCTLTYFPFLS